MLRTPRRLDRERKTIRVMIEMYCHGQHRSDNTLCPECSTLYRYAMQRMDRCPFQAEKPTCAKCPVHCYKEDRRDQVRSVMRYSGPRMIVRHPVLTVLHYWDQVTKSARSTADLKKHAKQNA